MAASLKLVLLVFLVFVPVAFPTTFAVSSAFTSTPIDPSNCTWKVVNEELECNGLIFIYEAQDTIGSARWWIDLTIVGVLLIFAGMFEK